MKKYWLQLIIGITVLVMAYQFLGYYPRVFSGSSVPAFPLLILSLLGIGVGWLLESSLLITFLRGKGGRSFHPDLLLGQGLLALILAFSHSLSHILAKSPLPDVFYRWLETYPAPLSLLGFVWLGITLLQSFSPQTEMFHVKQRRRKRDKSI